MDHLRNKIIFTNNPLTLQIFRYLAMKHKLRPTCYETYLQLGTMPNHDFSLTFNASTNYDCDK